MVTSTQIRWKNAKMQVAALILALMLFSVHIYFARAYTKTIWDNRNNGLETYYVFKPEVYHLLSLGERATVSRLNVLYSLFNPLNINIPSINFNRLLASMEGTRSLDDRNIQPYLHIAYYWSWNKKPENRAMMAEFMMPAMDKFPEMWDIPYAIYTFLRPEDAEAPASEEALTYLRTAADRAATYGGPAWIVDYPAILMSRDGQVLEAYLWLEEIYNKTEDPKHREMIEEQLANLEAQLKELGFIQAE